MSGGRGFRAEVGAGAAAAAVAGGALLLDPPEAGGWGLLAAPLVVVACVGAALRFGEAEGRRRPRLWPLLLAGGVAAGLYWWRVMSYRHFGMGGIPLVLFYGLAFWWPGLLVALGARLADRGLAPMPVRDFLLMLLAGGIGAGLGTGAYEAADELYYASRDRVPLEEALWRVRGPGAQLPPRAAVSVEHRDRTLAVDLSLAGDTETSYRVLERLHRYLSDVRPLVERHDTDSLLVRVDRGGRPLATAAIAATDGGRALSRLISVRREALPEGGDLTRSDVAAMVERALFEYELEGREPGAGPPGLAFGVAPDSLALSFRSDGPVSAETVVRHAAAWAAANGVVGAVRRFFPGVGPIVVRYPGLDTVVAADPENEAAGVGLQASLLPRSGIPVLEVWAEQGRSGRRETSAGTEDGRGAPEGFEAGRFCPDAAPRERRLAVVRVQGALTEHLLADLFLPATIGTGELFVTGVEPDGTVSLFVRRWQEEARGPAVVAPGDSTSLAGETVRNLGLVAAGTISCHGRPVLALPR